MSDNCNPSNSAKWAISAWSVLAYLLVTNIFTYKLTNFLFSSVSSSLATVDSNGAPTVFGYCLHLVVFFLLVRGMMEINLPM